MEGQRDVIDFLVPAVWGGQLNLCRGLFFFSAVLIIFLFTCPQRIANQSVSNLSGLSTVEPKVEMRKAEQLFVQMVCLGGVN